MPQLTKDEWAVFLSKHPQAHILQSASWGELKSDFGWQVYWLYYGDVAAQLLIRRFALGFNLAYLAKGPVGGDRLFNNSPKGDIREADENVVGLMKEIDILCQAQHCAFLKIEPDIWEVTPDSHGRDIPKGFRYSHHSIQPPRTMVLDIRSNEEQLLEKMKQKTRYNIRLAKKKGVMVKSSSDVLSFSKILDITSQRDGFGVHSREYYSKAYSLFHPNEEAELLIAEHEGQILAGLMIFARGKRAWYFYGGSSEIKRDLMPNYLLQWEAIRWARAHGCSEYDLWGVPDFDEQTLEDNFLNRSDGLWGVYRFKRGFCGRVLRNMGPFDRVYNAPVYWLYNAWVRRGGR
ncbi:MAG: peptidoglycan bridge formation glycyltransferase FemA/FemB family protein [Anaerolineales bacterium]|nr:peptidoglycan bridge formation glycyltransferase FemA/FemB family protein [Anaerolineales bacterium]